MVKQIGPRTRDVQEIVDTVRELGTGRQDSVGDVTLTPGTTTTVVPFQNCSKDCRVFLEAQTLNAAAAEATTYIQRADIIQRQFTITHANNGQTDRTFSFVCIGG